MMMFSHGLIARFPVRDDNTGSNIQVWSGKMPTSRETNKKKSNVPCVTTSIRVRALRGSQCCVVLFFFAFSLPLTPTPRDAARCLRSWVPPSQVKTLTTDGYTSLQLGVGESKWKNVNKAMAERFRLAGVGPKRKVRRDRIPPHPVVVVVVVQQRR